jgi:hypothetical protein
VVGLLELVLDHDLALAIGAEDVELEVTDGMLRTRRNQLAQPERPRQFLEIGRLGKPGREVIGLVLPRLAEGNADELAEGVDGGHGGSRLQQGLPY